MRYSLAERVWLQAALLLLALVPPTIMAGALDDRLLNDIPIWIKPMKFHVSVAVHLVTLAVLTHFLQDRTRKAVWLGVMAIISAAAVLLEILIITAQAARGTASHFNATTVTDALLYIAMGVGALLLILPALVLGIRFLTSPVTERLTPGLKLGAGLGLILGFGLTLVIAGYMSSQPDGHWVGAPLTDRGGLPIFGWSRQGGDLRVPHFFATHLMQALPLVGYLADRSMSISGNRSKYIVWAAALIGVVLAIGTFLQALSGQPFIA